MYELIVIACLMAEPANCEQFHVPFQRPLGVMECMRQGQFELVTWATDHPQWSVRRWSCGLPRT